jgi:uncharacterized protein YjbJ (UPF0337 family)
MTNWKLIEEQWVSLMVKVKTRWGKLSPAEIQDIGGKRPKLIAKLQENYKIFQLEAENQVNSWVTKLGLIDPSAPPPPATAAVPTVDSSVSSGVVVAVAEQRDPTPAPAVPT